MAPFLPAKGPAESSWDDKRESLGNFCRGNFHLGNHPLGSGLSYTAGIGLRPFAGRLRGLGFEGEFNGLNFIRKEGTDYETRGSRQVVSGNVLYHLGSSCTQFFLLGGLGILRAKYDSSIPDMTYHDEGTKMSLNLGLGLKIRLASRWAIRPELRIFDTTIGKGYNWNSVTFSCGVGYHW